MAQVPGNATAVGERAGLGRLIGVGLILLSLVLLALGVFLGPYGYSKSTPGKLTVQNCSVDYKYVSRSSHSRRRTKTRWCYGTFTAANGADKDLNAEVRSDALYKHGDVLDARKTGDTSYEQDHGWTGAIAVGCLWWFGALIPLGIGIFLASTGFAFGGSTEARRVRDAASPSLYVTLVALIGTGVVGVAISLLVMLFV